MNTRFFAAVMLSSTAGYLQASDIPVSQPLARYDSMVAKSPFALATVAAPAAPAAAPFASNLFVAGVAKIGGKDVVTIHSRSATDPHDPKSSFSLSPGEKGPDEIELIGVEWDDLVGKTKVKIRKGNEDAKIEFDQANLQRTIAPAVVRPPNGDPRRGPGGPDSKHRGIIQPPNVPPVPPVQPSQAMPPSPQVPMPNPGSNSMHQSHRVRIIPSRPVQ